VLNPKFTLVLLDQVNFLNYSHTFFLRILHLRAFPPYMMQHLFIFLNCILFLFILCPEANELVQMRQFMTNRYMSIKLS